MNEQQRAVAVVQGSLTEHVIVERASETAQALYALRVSVRGNDPGVTIAPEPPSSRERGRVLLEAHRLLGRRRERATMETERQMLTQARINVTRAIVALP